MDLLRSPSNYSNRETAIKAVVQSLTAGQLVLFIGAGISKAATDLFPKWEGLVESCCNMCDIQFDTNKGQVNEYLLERAERVEGTFCGDPGGFAKLVHSCLYSGVEYTKDLMKTDLLVSLGSLVMSSVRGSARAVVNYNFDDLLEWYLDHHGFFTQVVSSLPVLSTRADVTIYHPHGFLPLEEKYKSHRTDRITLSEASYQKTIADPLDLWNQTQRLLLSSNCALFIGMSGDDKHLDGLLLEVYEKVLEKRRMVGFFVTETKESKEREEHNLQRGVANLYVDDYKELPELLLEFCRRAVAGA